MAVVGVVRVFLLVRLYQSPMLPPFSPPLFSIFRLLHPPLDRCYSLLSAKYLLSTTSSCDPETMMLTSSHRLSNSPVRAPLSQVLVLVLRGSELSPDLACWFLLDAIDPRNGGGLRIFDWEVLI